MRSEFINKLIKSFVCKKKADVMIVEDSKQEHICYTFKDVCKVIDKAVTVKITVRSLAKGDTYGICELNIAKTGADQLVRHENKKANYMSLRVEQAK